MWTAQVLMENGQTRELKPFSIEGQHVPMRELASLIADAIANFDGPVPMHLFDTMYKEDPTPWADPIPAWALQLANYPDAGFTASSSREADGDLTIISKLYGLQIWHEKTVAIIPIPAGAVQLGITYESDQLRALRGYVRADSNREGELLPTLDARLYSGENSVILEADSAPFQVDIRPEILHDRQARFRWLLGVAKTSGVLIGRIARRFIRKPLMLTSDPGFKARLLAEEARVAIPLSGPRIEHFVPGNCITPIVVVVHGTFSCSVAIAAAVRSVCSAFNVVRFEHDTFVPITENVNDLISHIRRIAALGVSQILLLAHSRGGLVACQAASLLRGAVPSLKIDVWTVGTPHFGTPLAGVGGSAAQVLGAMYRLCARLVDGTVKATYVEGAASYLVSAGQLPTGIAAMRQGSDFLDLHRLHAQCSPLRTWGGRCSRTAPGSLGHGLLLNPALAEIFQNQDHDLVVPTASAIIDASPPLDDCNHFQYFDRDELQAALCASPH